MPGVKRPQVKELVLTLPASKLELGDRLSRLGQPLIHIETHGAVLYIYERDLGRSLTLEDEVKVWRDVLTWIE